jgi:hypothetical protein
MRRFTATLLVLIIGFAVLAPAMAASDIAVPKCCRRDQPRHCHQHQAPSDAPAARASAVVKECPQQCCPPSRMLAAAPVATSSSTRVAHSGQSDLPAGQRAAFLPFTDTHLLRGPPSHS